MHILKTVPVVALLLTQACFQIAHASMPSTKPRTYTAADGTVFVFDRSLRKWVIESASKVEAPEDGKQLLLKDRAFPFNFSKGEFKICGWPIVIHASEQSRAAEEQQHADTGRIVWDGAVLLAKSLESTFSKLIEGARVIELGSGTGLAGLSAAAVGAKTTVLTDLPYCLDGLRRNIRATFESAEQNGSCESGCSTASDTSTVGDVTAQALDWFQPDDSPLLQANSVDVILGADIIWVEELAQPLARVMALLLRQNQEAIVLLSHQTRSLRTDTLFFKALRQELALSDEDDSSCQVGHVDAQVVAIPREQMPADFGRDIEVLHLFAIGRAEILGRHFNFAVQDSTTLGAQ